MVLYGGRGAAGLDAPFVRLPGHGGPARAQEVTELPRRLAVHRMPDPGGALGHGGQQERRLGGAGGRGPAKAAGMRRELHQVDRGAVQRPGGGAKAAASVDGCTEPLHDGSDLGGGPAAVELGRPDAVAPGSRERHLAEPGQQRRDQVEGAVDHRAQPGRHGHAPHRPGVQLPAAARQAAVRAHLAQDAFEHKALGRDRYVVERHRLSHRDRGGHQDGEGVLVPADRHDTVQAPASLDHDALRGRCEPPGRQGTTVRTPHRHGGARRVRPPRPRSRAAARAAG